MKFDLSIKLTNLNHLFTLNTKPLLKPALFKIFVVLLLLITISSTPVKASIISYKKKLNGIVFKLDKGLMMVTVCQEDIIEVKYTLLDSFDTKPSLIINAKWKFSPFKILEDKSHVIITTARLRVCISKTNNNITYETIGGSEIVSEDSKSITPITIAGINTYNVCTQFNSPANEALYGLGCHPLDSLSINYKGRNQDMAIKYMTGAIPVLLSTKGYGLMWDNYSASNFYGAEADNTKFKYVSESGKQVDYYFFYGPDFDHIINLYRIATGKAPMFPKWALGCFSRRTGI